MDSRPMILLKRILRPVRAFGRGRPLWYSAYIWRRLMFRTTVVAITGSVGKSTAKECLAAVLATQGPTLKTLNNENGLVTVPRTLLRIRPWHRYAVIEIGTEMQGQIRRSARLVKPDVALIVSVARTHTNAFPTLEHTTVEKRALIEQLPADGIAVLNGDNPYVRGMAEGFAPRVVIYGQTDDCDVIGGNVSAAWPQRLSLTLRAGDEEVPVRTQLVGKHWLSSVLGAISTARALGVPLGTAAEAIATVPPFVGRMQPVALPNGAIVIRDEEAASVDSVESMFEVMREAKARRRILLFSDLSDEARKTRQRLRAVGETAGEMADVVIFVDEHARHGIRGALNAGVDPANCHAIISYREAADLLKKELRAGDLVFIKGRGTDHLSRIVFAQFGEIGCWITNCKIRSVCDLCPRLKPRFNLGKALSQPIVVEPAEEARPV
jgi:UDP-N-acetylmuramoyl-tripeptide--D-alanyl-D-alanine ligase